MIWAQGSPSTLRAVTTTIAGVRLTLAAAVCWENYMPLLRQSLYSQNVNLYLAPTADARDTWVPLMRTIACEGRCVVLSSNQCIRREHLPTWLRGTSEASRKELSERPKHVRRASSVTKTEDDHEICWPAPRSSSETEGASEPAPTNGSHEAPKPTTSGSAIADDDSAHSGAPQQRPSHRRTSSVTKTDDHNEISWPAPQRSSEAERPPKPAAATGAYKPSRLSTSSSAISEEESAAETATERRRKQRRASIVTKTEDNHEITWPVRPHGQAESVSSDQAEIEAEGEFLCRGGSCIVGPTGDVLAGPLWEVDDGSMLTVEVDLDDCDRGRLDLDVAGSYSRNDAFKLEVVGLDLNPPP